MKAPSDFHATKMARLARLGLVATDFDEKFARASGPGGQHVNKVSTAVTLRHRPSRLAVTVQDSRSQSFNRQLAWQRLLDLIERTRHEQFAARRAAREKERRRAAPRPWAVKQRMLDDKKRRGRVKKLRTDDGHGLG
jgi:protein subunit release factor B